tara:strand:- start:573 stop:749 length:177 start_codon:yes stop_codon:yes gene_type:complete
MLTGYKTLIFSGLTALLGVATAFDWTSVVNAQTSGYILIGIAAISSVLRFLTKGPVSG